MREDEHRRARGGRREVVGEPAELLLVEPRGVAVPVDRMRAVEDDEMPAGAIEAAIGPGEPEPVESEALAEARLVLVPVTIPPAPYVVVPKAGLDGKARVRLEDSRIGIPLRHDLRPVGIERVHHKIAAHEDEIRLVRLSGFKAALEGEEDLAFRSDMEVGEVRDPERAAARGRGVGGAGGQRRGGARAGEEAAAGERRHSRLSGRGQRAAERWRESSSQ
jgi:hypothetical protein